MNDTNQQRPKVALVHDFLTYWGGAEQVLLSLHHLYPEAPIYTLLFDEKMRAYFPDARIRTSFLDRLPGFLRKRKRLLLPLMPTATENFDLGAFDLVISSSSSFAKGVVVKPRTLHIDYCHTPTRFLWDWYYEYLEENNLHGIKKMLAVGLLHFLRLWDRSAAERVDRFVANSACTASRIRKYYRADSRVIYPPVDVEKLTGLGKDFVPEEKDYYLIVSRLSPYKKIDTAVTALGKMHLPLVVIGEGSDRQRLEKLASDNVRFLGFQSEDRLASYYRHARALIFPGEDDFGITILEAMAFGKPVLAYGRGGALETVRPGVNGELFDSQVPEILADGIRRLNKNYAAYDPERIKLDAGRFSRERFEREMCAFIESACAESQDGTESELIKAGEYAKFSID